MRPTLNSNTDPEEFKNYYWLKEELSSFCKTHNISRSGNKADLTDKVYHFLKTGKVSITITSLKTKKSMVPNTKLSIDAKIPEGYRNDENHRSFFKQEIGDHFKFNVPFMNWMKQNSGRTYEDAIAQWQKIIEEKKNGKKRTISGQFEYNEYTRDFFLANPKALREDAIKCWKYKKSLPGQNSYEDSDLNIINETD